MKNRMYIFQFKVPLQYYSYDIRENNQESELIIGLTEPIVWEKAYMVDEIYPLKAEQRYQSIEKIMFSLENMVEKSAIETDVKNGYILNANNVIANKKEKAFSIVEEEIQKICRALSITISSKNCNKQGFQPRVSPVYREITSEKALYSAYMDLYSDECDSMYFDEDGN